MISIGCGQRLTTGPPNGLQSAVSIPVETPVDDELLAREVILVDIKVTDNDEHIVNKLDNLKERPSFL